MSTLSHIEALKVRAKWFCNAMSEVTGKKALSGLSSVTLYSQLLGFENHSQLVQLYKVDPRDVGMRIDFDWDINQQSINVLERFYPECNQNEFYRAESISSYMIESGSSESWKKTVSRLITKCKDLRYLRAFSKDFVYMMPETLSNFSNHGELSTAVRYRLRVVVMVLMDLAKHNKLGRITIRHISDLLQPDHFTTLTFLFFENSLGLSNDLQLKENLTRYIDISLSQSGGRDIAIWQSMVPVFSNLLNTELPSHDNAVCQFYPSGFEFTDDCVFIKDKTDKSH